MPDEPPPGTRGRALLLALARLRRVPGDAPERAVAQVEALAAASEARVAAGVSGALPSLPRALPGGQVDGPQGPLHVVSRQLSADACYGHQPLAAAIGLSGTAVARLALDPRLEGVDFDAALYLDTETTGLAGGAGTVPFLVGLGWFSAGCWQSEQLLLSDLDQEVAQLQRLRSHLERSRCLVTYNGKSFDWPLLRSRSILQRVPLPMHLPHLDLLHCSRRLLKHRLPRVNLGEVERCLLGAERHGDVAGAAIPALYFAYLRGAPPATLTPILEHNAADLVAMAALLPALLRRLEPDLAAGGLSPGCPHAGADALSAAQVHLRAGAADWAAPFLARAGNRVEQRTPEIFVAATLLRARLARRSGQTDRAHALLVHALARVAANALVAAPLHLELAKLEEHALRRWAQALVHAEAAGRGRAEPELINARRCARLRRRLARLATESMAPRRWAQA